MSSELKNIEGCSGRRRHLATFLTDTVTDLGFQVRSAISRDHLSSRVLAGSLSLQWSVTILFAPYNPQRVICCITAVCHPSQLHLNSGLLRSIFSSRLQINPGPGDNANFESITLLALYATKPLQLVTDAEKLPIN